MIQVNITKKGAKSAKRPDKKGFNFYYIKKERKGSKKATKKDEHNEAKKAKPTAPFSYMEAELHPSVSHWQTYVLYSSRTVL